MKLSEMLPTILEAIEREAFTAGYAAGFRAGQRPEAERRSRPMSAFREWQAQRAAVTSPADPVRDGAHPDGRRRAEE